jgi:hypothetical protein
MAPLAPVKRRVVVAASAGAILVAGTLLKPAAPAPPSAAETPAPILQQVVQQREAETVFRRMRAAWPQVARFTARIDALPPPAATTEWGPPDPTVISERFGLVAGPHHVLADAADEEEGSIVRVTIGDSRAFEARVTTRFPAMSMILVETPENVALDTAPRAPAVGAGTALFAAAPRADGNVIAPLFVAHASRRELLTTNTLDAFRGMPVFDLEGRLAGLLAFTSGQVRLLTVDAALAPVSRELVRRSSMTPEP